jgi:DivIVA domain-containing protein
MAGSEMGGNDSESAKNATVPPDVEPSAAGLEGTRATKQDRSARRLPSSRVMSPTERDRLLQDARNIEFPIALRGYERAAVDRYVEHVNRVLAELEISSSPESAVRHALEEVSEETRDLLQRAHHTADEITARSRARADDRLEQAERDSQAVLEAAQQGAEEIREAAQQEVQHLREVATREAKELRETTQHATAELRETTMQQVAELRETAARETQQLRAAAEREADAVRGSARRDADEMLDSAETRARELTRNAQAIWRERRRLIEDMQAVGEQLVALGEIEAKRFTRPAEEMPLGAERRHEQTSTTAGEPAPEPHEAGRI